MRTRELGLRWGLGIAAACGVLCFPAVAGAEQATFKAVMIHASDREAAPDKRLQNIEGKLRRVFRYEHYRHAGEGSLTLNLPGEGTIRLGSAHTLHLSASPAKDGRVQTKVTWKKGGATLLSTSAKVKRGSPTVLGGASQGDGKLIVTLVLK